MHGAAFPQILSLAGRKDIPAFRVAIVYEDFRAGRLAQRAFDFLVRSLARPWQVSNQMWKFELLRIPELHDMAAEDVALADLIIVACQDERELPSEVCTCLANALSPGTNAVALFGVFDRPPEQLQREGAAQAYLKRVAEQAHLEFFLWPQGLPEETTLGLAVAAAAEPLRRVA